MSCLSSGRGVRFTLWFIAVGMAMAVAGRSLAEVPLPAASEVTGRMIARAQAVARGERGPQYAYEKRSLLEHLDGTGKTTKSEEKVHEVTLVAGFPFNRLVKIQGRDLTSEELKKEQQKEERFRQRFMEGNPEKMAARKEAWVTPELLERYRFEIKERVTLQDRPTLVMSFQPKESGLPGRTVKDKLLNRMAGTVWVDEQDSDAAKLTVHLTESISMGLFGLLGSLSQCELSLERKRMPEGVWVNAKQILLIQCRKLATPLRFRSTEDSRGFKKFEGHTLNIK